MGKVAEPMVTDAELAISGTTKSFLLCGGTTGVLLIHGWLGLPDELRPLGEFLAHHGYTVAGVLLAGHGGHPDKLHTIRWQQWYTSVETSYAELTARCSDVVVLGYSLGGLLALHLAAQRPVAGVITLAAALRFAGGWPLRLLSFGRLVMPWLYPFRGAGVSNPQLRAQLVSRMGPVDFDNPSVVADLGRSIRISTRSIYEVVRLSQHVRRELTHIHQPALIMQGRLDTTVLPASATQIHQLLGSQDKQIAWFERSGHLLPNDVEQRQVRKMIVQWLDQHIPHGQSTQQKSLDK